MCTKGRRHIILKRGITLKEDRNQNLLGPMFTEESFREESFREWRRLNKVYEFAIKEISTKINILIEEFKVFHEESPVEHIKTRVKEPRSIVAKLRKLGHDPTPENAKEYLNDIAGIRIVCSYSTDVYRIFEMLCNQSDIKLLKFKDYIKNPKESGYQSLHMIIAIPVFLSDGPMEVKVEIQIRTIAMDFWASLEHKLHYKYYDVAPEHIENELRDCAKLISELDHRMLRIKTDIDEFE